MEDENKLIQLSREIHTKLSALSGDLYFASANCKVWIDGRPLNEKDLVIRNRDAVTEHMDSVWEQWGRAVGRKP